MSSDIPADIAIRQFVYSLIDVEHANTVVDAGCSNGYDLQEIARLLPKEARLIGIDGTESAIDAASAQTRGDERFSFTVSDIAGGLPLDDRVVDVFLSKNVLECIIYKDAHVREIHRVLRPGGQVICAHYDWDSQIIDGVDKNLVRKIVHAFGDWKQDWMNDCDAWMGRRLWRTFQRSGLFDGSVHAKVLAETDFVPGSYGYQSIHSFQALARRCIIEQDDYDRFLVHIEELASKGEYFYSITMYVYSGRSI